MPGAECPIAQRPDRQYLIRIMPAKEGVLLSRPASGPHGRTHVAIVGGGVIGLTCALALAEPGRRITVFDEPGAATPASSVAGGMLAAVGEARIGEDALWDLLRRGAGAWDRLLPVLGQDVVTADDTVMVGTDPADLKYVESVGAWVVERGGVIEAMGSRGTRHAVAGSGPRVRGGLIVKGERAVDNSTVLKRLRALVVEAGVQVIARRVEDIRSVEADQVVIAAGRGSSRLWPGLAIHPVKGEVLRLSRGRYALPPPECVVRALVGGRPVYVVPRRDGVVVGATSYDQNADDVEPQVGGVVDLLADAMTVLPGLRDYRLAAIQAGFRPGTADGLPMIGRLDAQVYAATGHGRNGFALAALTGELIRDIVDGGDGPTELDPQRHRVRLQGGIT